MFLSFSNWFVYKVLGISESTSFGSALHFFVYDVIKILFLLFIIITIISFIRSYINNDKIKKYIEKQPKFIAYFISSIFGAITPFCSCSSIPVFIGFIEAGVPFGITMSFLITSPMINEIAVLVLAGVLGWKITILYVITGIMVGTFSGMIMQKLCWEKYLQDYLKNKPTKKKCCCSCGCKKSEEEIIKITIKERFLSSVIYSKNLIKKIFPFILIGVGVGAFLHGYVPQSFFIKYMGNNNIFAVPLAVLAGIPLYSDATTIIPIAQVLISKGAALGTVLVFMMAVVGLSLPEMIILLKVMTKKLIIRFAIFMFVAFTIIGYFYNFVLRFVY